MLINVCWILFIFQTEYLVKWKGYPYTANTWEPATSFIDPNVLVIYYENLRNNAAAARAREEITKTDPMSGTRDNQVLVDQNILLLILEFHFECPSFVSVVGWEKRRSVNGHGQQPPKHITSINFIIQQQHSEPITAI